MVRVGLTIAGFLLFHHVATACSASAIRYALEPQTLSHRELPGLRHRSLSSSECARLRTFVLTSVSCDLRTRRADLPGEVGNDLRTISSLEDKETPLSPIVTIERGPMPRIVTPGADDDVELKPRGAGNANPAEARSAPPQGYSAVEIVEDNPRPRVPFWRRFGLMAAICLALVVGSRIFCRRRP